MKPDYETLNVEAGEGRGGTWYWNTHPGIAVDIPSFSYSRIRFNTKVTGACVRRRARRLADGAAAHRFSAHPDLALPAGSGAAPLAQTNIWAEKCE
jgi:cation diffusion facilitator CzcD-associated flavoprotein CzcO